MAAQEATPASASGSQAPARPQATERSPRPEPERDAWLEEIAEESPAEEERAQGAADGAPGAGTSPGEGEGLDARPERDEATRVIALAPPGGAAPGEGDADPAEDRPEAPVRATRNASGQDRIFRASRSTPRVSAAPGAAATGAAASGAASAARPAGPDDAPERPAVHGPLPAPAPVPVPERVREATVEPIGSPPSLSAEAVAPDADSAAAEGDTPGSRRRSTRAAGGRTSGGRTSGGRRGDQPVFRPELIRSAGDERPAGDGADDRWAGGEGGDEQPEPSAMEALACLYPPPESAESPSPGKGRRRRLRRS